MKFRLNQIQVEDVNYHTDKIVLVNNKNDKLENHFTVLVGNNGTGKSRLLGSITNVLRGNFKSKNSDLFLFSHFEKTNVPSKIISVSNSLSDKFPLDSSFRTRIGEDFSYREERYNYLGTRGRMGATSQSLIRRAIDILLENYSNKNVSKCYRHVFDYLDYLPIIKLEYRIINIELTNNPFDEIKPRHILDYVKKRVNYSSLSKNTFQNFEGRYGDKINSICLFLNNLKEKNLKKFELEIDFSTPLLIFP